MVRGTGIEPATSSVSGKRSPAELTAPGRRIGGGDGIRTREPHLGKVMRYQLRYIRAQRTRSSPGAKHDDSPREWARTNFLVPSGESLSAADAACSAETAARANLRP